ncbi:MAG TPA: YHS domain-containing (seleno)protein [Chryseosolibacter sp.]|nr:YHS domain-containing (seleno)protein [Chryseosolibacter sp.]
MKSLRFYLLILLCGCNSDTSVQEVFTTDGVAIRGYDPVAYHTDGAPVAGSDAYTLEWRDATWKFATAENMAAFENNPEKYAPQFGGYCAYGVADDHKASTSPDAWTIVDGKLYLNYDKDVQALWKSKQSEFIETANRNWPEVKLQKY